MIENVTFSLVIESGNAAVVEDPSRAVTNMLVSVARRCEAGQREGHIFDENGNKVGEWEMLIEESEGEEE